MTLNELIQIVPATLRDLDLTVDVSPPRSAGFFYRPLHSVQIDTSRTRDIIVLVPSHDATTHAVDETRTEEYLQRHRIPR